MPRVVCFFTVSNSLLATKHNRDREGGKFDRELDVRAVSMSAICGHAAEDWIVCGRGCRQAAGGRGGGLL